MIKAQNISIRIGHNEILHDVSFEIPTGTICYILGHNGSGKSTLLKSMLGVYEPSSGDIFLDDIKVLPANRLQFLPSVGALIEQASLYGHLTVRQNIDLFRRYYDHIAPSHTDEILHLINCPPALADRQARYLSMGWKLRVGLGISLLNNPSIVLLDEPTNALDPEAREAFLLLIKNLNRHFRTTFVICSHQLDEVEAMASQVIILRNGQVAFDSLPLTGKTFGAQAWGTLYRQYQFEPDVPHEIPAA